MVGNMDTIADWVAEHACPPCEDQDRKIGGWMDFCGRPSGQAVVIVSKNPEHAAGNAEQDDDDEDETESCDGIQHRWHCKCPADIRLALERSHVRAGSMHRQAGCQSK